MGTIVWAARTAADPWPWSDRTVHVCRARLDEANDAATFETLLTIDEKARADRMLSPRHRARFVAARAYLRQMLGSLLDVPPAAVEIEIGPHGKPALGTAHASLQFNLSHCGDLALYAFSRHGPVGVDVEQVRADMAWAPLAARFFAPEESAALAALPQSRQVEGFFACWTRKEAVLKATGAGLSHLLRDVVVPVDPDAPPGPLATLADGWTIVELDPAPGHRAALAAAGPVDVRPWTWASVHSR